MIKLVSQNTSRTGSTSGGGGGRSSSGGTVNPPVVTPVCSDSDGGLNFFNQGGISKENEILFTETVRGNDEIIIYSLRLLFKT